MIDIVKLTDVFFNGRSAQERKSTVTIDQIIKRKSCVVRYGKKFYRIEATQVELQTKQAESGGTR